MTDFINCCIGFPTEYQNSIISISNLNSEPMSVGNYTLGCKDSMLSTNFEEDSHPGANPKTF